MTTGILPLAFLCRDNGVHGDRADEVNVDGNELSRKLKFSHSDLMASSPRV